MRRTPRRSAIVLALVALTSPLPAGSAASPITSFIEAGAWQSAEAQRPSNEWLAWRLGRAYAYASAFSLAKKSAESEEYLDYARRYAKPLGISVPPPAAVYLDNTSAMANEVTAKYGLTTGRLFLLGIRVVDATFGAAIGGDVKARLTGLTSLLKSSGIPTSVWSTQLQAVQAKATEPELKKLDEAIDEHLKRLPGVLPGKL